MTAPPAPATAPLHDDLRSEVLVIGAGYTGLSAALRLAERGVPVAVIEARAIGYGGSGRNVGLVNAGLWLPLPDIIRHLGEDAGEKLIEVLGEAPATVFGLIERHGIECEAVRNGTLHCADSIAGLRDLEQRTTQWAQRGAPVELLDAGATAERLGSTAFRASLLDRRAGTIQPLAYARGLARAAIAAGAIIHTDSPALDIRREGTAWRARTPHGSVKAERVIVAVNAYGEDGFRDAGQRLVALYFFQFATPPLSARRRAAILPGREGAWDTHAVLTSLRLDAAGRLLIGSVGCLGGSGHALHRGWARRALARIYPTLAGEAFEFGWGGRIGMTRDHLPRISQPASGMVCVTGYNGRGIGPGTVFGRALADFAMNGRAEDLPLPIQPEPSACCGALRGFAIESGARASHFFGCRSAARRSSRGSTRRLDDAGP